MTGRLSFPPTSSRSEGFVEDFDEAAGLGTVRGDDGRAYPFHCTQLLDGTRTITPGARVGFAVGPGLPGRWEARRIAPL